MARDSRIRVIDQENQGVAAARNSGLEFANAPYTLILDSDDIFAPDMFGKLYRKARATNADIVVCSSCEFDGETYESIPAPWALKHGLLPKSESFSVQDVSSSLFQAFMGWPWDRLYRTSFLKNSALGFPVDMANSEDAVFVYGLLYRASVLAIVDDVLVKHRSTRRGSVSNSREKDPECFYEAICRIKADLKSIGLYASLERSFLNWALDYTIWNVSTLKDVRTKERLSRALTSGKLPELEVADHSWLFFNLYGLSNFKGYYKLKFLR